MQAVVDDGGRDVVEGRPVLVADTVHLLRGSDAVAKPRACLSGAFVGA